mgnify:CR=1 FL=1
MDFDPFFEQEIKERKSKTFKTKTHLEKLIQGEIHPQQEDTEGTTIQYSKDNVEDILKRNVVESRDIPLERVIFK